LTTGTGGKFTAGVVDTGSASGVIDTGGAPFVGNIFANFRKNLNYGINRGPKEDEVKNPETVLNKNTDIFTFYNPRMERQLLIVAAYVYSSCEDKNITLGSLRHLSIEIINVKTRTIVYCTTFDDRCF
jgi:hypothetical protein